MANERPYRKSVMEKTSIAEEPVAETIVEPIVVEPIVETVVEQVVEPVKDPWPKKYICRVKCWVASKVRIVNPGEVIEFTEGEFVPSHFEEIK